MIVELPPGAPRLSLRWAAPDGASDVVGHLVAANDDWYVIQPENRLAVWIPRGQAESVRRVPERTVLPVSRPEDLEGVLDGSRATTRRARLGGWRLSDCLIVAGGDPGMPIDEAVREAEAWPGRPATVRLPTAGAARAFSVLGFTASAERIVLTADRPTLVEAAVPLARGSVLDVDAYDVAAVGAAAAAGYVERYRAVLLTRV